MTSMIDAALDALPDRPITALDLDIFDAAWMLEPHVGDAQGMADKIAELAAGGYDLRVVHYAANLVMRSEERCGLLADVPAFVAEVRAAITAMCAVRAANEVRADLTREAERIIADAG